MDRMFAVSLKFDALASMMLKLMPETEKVWELRYESIKVRPFQHYHGVTLQWLNGGFGLVVSEAHPIISCGQPQFCRMYLSASR